MKNDALKRIAEKVEYAEYCARWDGEKSVTVRFTPTQAITVAALINSYLKAKKDGMPSGWM